MSIYVNVGVRPHGKPEKRKAGERLMAIFLEPKYSPERNRKYLRLPCVIKEPDNGEFKYTHVFNNSKESCRIEKWDINREGRLYPPHQISLDHAKTLQELGIAYWKMYYPDDDGNPSNARVEIDRPVPSKMDRESDLWRAYCEYEKVSKPVFDPFMTDVFSEFERLVNEQG